MLSEKHKTWNHMHKPILWGKMHVSTVTKEQKWTLTELQLQVLHRSLLQLKQGRVGRNVKEYVNIIRIPVWLEGSSGDWGAWVTNSNYRNHLRSAQELGSGAGFAKCVRRTPDLWDVKRFFHILNMLRDVGLNRASCTGDCNWGSA